ncbi:MAG: ATP-binding protein [Methanocorpusculum sp.]|uniref:ATP-binding protein n=1 Tax=Methanocorpusculum sp. TaxID=2058474 RepID=UPI00271F2DE4|nr:ATP-binding protein [Methanocorpusculum sp.]MDO9522290.1 ATP-binding protein [Methanocorpusculum sp.]
MVFDGNVKFGKNVIENLTTGMYEDSKIIYREYIQNAADSIDKALRDGLYEEDDEPSIEIDIFPDERLIKITDNAYGIKAQDIVKTLIDVADSEKVKGVDKGFRGIGRLGGLGYCKLLKFITTYPDENIQTTVIYDGELLQKYLNDFSIKMDAEEILQKIITVQSDSCSAASHYFIVELHGVRKDNDELLDPNKITRYVSEVAPLDYANKFYLRSKIYEYLEENDLKLTDYRVTVDGFDVLRDYTTKLYEKDSGADDTKKQYDEITHLEFEDFRDNDGRLIAWMWFGISRFDRQIPIKYNPMAGLKLLKENIQIDNGAKISRFFKEPRGNLYFIGEIHAVDKDLIPNGRRDYFEETPTRVIFEAKLEAFINDTLYQLYREASVVKSIYQSSMKVQELKEEYEQKSQTGFINETEQKVLIDEIKSKEDKWVKDREKVEKIKDKAKDNPILTQVINNIEKKYDNEVTISKPSEKGLNDKKIDKPAKKDPEKQEKTVLLTDKLTNLSQNERKLVERIYSVISKVLDPEKSQKLIHKIQSELQK